MPTLTAPQRRQTGKASPNGYAYGTSAQPNGDSTAKRLRSDSLSLSFPLAFLLSFPIPRSCSLLSRSFLTHTCSPIGVAKRRSHPPNGYAQILSSSPFPFSLSSLPTLGVAKRRWHHLMPTLRTRQRSQTRVASPDTYAYSTSAQPDGEGTTKRLRSEPANVAKWRRHHQMATLRARQHSQMEKTSPNDYAQNPSAQSDGEGTTKRLRWKDRR